MPSEPQNVDRIESAANVTLQISQGQMPDDLSGDADSMQIPISSLDRTKDIEISEVREDQLKASGYSITAISFSGSMSFTGNSVRLDPDSNATSLDELVFDDEGVPEPLTITISHELDDGDSTTFTDVLVTSSSYEVESESETETAYDWIAMDKK